MSVLYYRIGGNIIPIYIYSARISRDLYSFIVNAGKLGDSMNCRVFVVGGFVRDLLLNKPNDDVDLVIEGNGITYADNLADVIYLSNLILTQRRNLGKKKLNITKNS